MKRIKMNSLTAVVAVCASLFAVPAMSKGKTPFTGSISVKGKSKSEYSTLAKISLQDATAAATKATSGKVLEAALDREDGFLVYEIEILMANGSKKELLIDAGDGKVLLTKDKGKKFFGDDDDKDDDENGDD